MWISPTILGFNPSERWGHSACYYDGSVYVFGGCCGGKHFSDVLALDTKIMTWSRIMTVGYGPSPRDSHSCVLVGHKMVVFGGTNGSKKVNDLHVLDLRFKEWGSPVFSGSPPSPRESHSAALVGDENMVVFGGSGEGDGVYLNDVYVLDLKTMRWCCPDVRGDIPVARDSHSAIGIGRKMLVIGGDSGDRCHGDVHVFDLDTLTWKRLAIPGALPGFRAGHAVVNIGMKVFVIGGVGDKNYNGDVWVLDLSCALWNKVEISGKQPQGRFSHTATLCDSDVIIYGGCGEDDRPLNELVVLQINDGHIISSCKLFGNLLNYPMHESASSSKKISYINSKRRRIHSHILDTEVESFSLSHKTSSSYSDHEQAPRIQNAQKNKNESHGFASFKKIHQRNPNPRINIAHDFHNPGRRLLKHPTCSEPFMSMMGQQDMDSKSSEAGPIGNLMGAEVHGNVDGMVDSGFLMTAMVDGKLFRGILFTPVPSHESNSASVHAKNFKALSFTDVPTLVQTQVRNQKMCDLDGAVLTLASPGTHHHQN